MLRRRIGREGMRRRAGRSKTWGKQGLSSISNAEYRSPKYPSPTSPAACAPRCKAARIMCMYVILHTRDAGILGREHLTGERRESEREREGRVRVSGSISIISSNTTFTQLYRSTHTTYDTASQAGHSRVTPPVSTRRTNYGVTVQREGDTTSSQYCPGTRYPEVECIASATSNISITS